MTTRRTVLAVVTARPSYSRIKTALKAIDEHPDLELRLVVAASALLERYGKVVDVMRDDGFEPDAVVYMVVEGGSLSTMAKSTGLGLIELATQIENIQPDVVLTVADRYETIATAIAASYLNVPVAHVQGGEVTGSIDEKVRHAVTKLSNIHLVSTEQAADWVIRMGEHPDTVFVTGCPSIDIAADVAGRPDADFDPFERYAGVGPVVDLEGGYLTVLQHPDTTTHASARDQIDETLHAIDELGRPTLWFWPNVDAGSDGTSKGIRAYRESHSFEHVHFFKNAAPDDFLRILLRSGCLIGNSSAAIRECSYLGVPAVNIGDRQQGRLRGPNVIDVDYDRTQIIAAVREHDEHGRPGRDEVYGDGRAGERVAEILARTPLSADKRLSYGDRP